MKRAAVLLSLSYIALSVAAAVPLKAEANNYSSKSNTISCNIESDFQPGMKGQAFVFKRDEGRPRLVAIGGGRLFFDGQEAKLNAADQASILEMEKQMRKMVPEAQAIALEATDVAFAALIETSKALAPSDTKLQAELAKARIQSHKTIRAPDFFVSNTSSSDTSSDDFIEQTMAPVIGQYLTAITGNTVSEVIAIAVSNDGKASLKGKAFSERMQNMQKTLEKEVEKRAEALAPKAENFCKGMKNLDAIENKIGYQFPNQQRFELFRISTD
jgi:predicted RNA-binding protein with PIN domain